MTDYDLLIVGAGHGGAQLAIAARQRGFAGSIALAGDEPEAPYERPPLSKEYLAGDKSFERLLIRPLAFWEERAITRLPATRVVAVDAAAHRVTAADGREFRYRTLVWAAGGVPRRLGCDGHDLAGVHSVRTRADVDRIIADLPATRHVAVVGGGYIGLEAAAVLTKLGRQVTVVEAQDRVLARVAGEPLARAIERVHQSHGVALRLGSSVDCILGANGRVRGVRLRDGEEIACDMVIVGIGIVPAVEPLIAAGAQGVDGVQVDAQCRTSLPDIFAIGDCAAHANPYADGAVIRLESVQNAHDQATVVARVLTGESASYDAVPWFWSNQFDLKLQTVGLSTGHDQTVVRGDPDTGQFSVIYLKKGRVIALDCVNQTRDYVQGRALVIARAEVAPERLADTAVPLKEIGRQSEQAD